MGQSRNEDILESMIAGTEYTKVPQSREEQLLIDLKDVIEGSGGTTNYESLSNKPKINNVELNGNKSLDDIGVSSAIQTEVARIVADAPEDFDTLKEMSDWIATHEDDAAAMNSAILQNASDISNLEDSKVDKVGGKGLSTNDYTTTEKSKLAGLSNYDDTQVRADILSLNTNKADKSAIYTKAETDALLNEKQDTLTSVQLAAVNSGVTAKKITGYDDVFAVLNYNALNHNSIYRGKNLTGVYTIEQIYNMIHSGNFDDLFLGDYINVSITTTLPDETVKTETVSLMIAAFDYYCNCGDTALTTHHIVFIPRDQGFATTAKMNDTNTTEGGYLNSYMHQTVLLCYADSLRTALNNHLLSHRTILSNAVNTSTPSMAGVGLMGASSDWTWTTVELQLMNEVQVYGTTIWSSSAYDTGADNRQLPVFKFINPVQFGRSSFWLRSVVSSTYFAHCYTGGVASYLGASYTLYVRPLILFG